MKFEPERASPRRTVVQVWPGSWGPPWRPTLCVRALRLGFGVLVVPTVLEAAASEHPGPIPLED
jgi:hypothetical protein